MVKSAGSVTRRWVVRACVVAVVAGGVIGIATPAMALGGYSAAGVVDLRPAPDTIGGALTQTSDGQALDLRCQAAGETVSGTAIWDFTTVNGRTGWVSDNFVDGTPYAVFDSRLPRCGDAGTRVKGQTTSGGRPVAGPCVGSALEQWYAATGYYPYWTGNAKDWKNSAGTYGWMVVLDAQVRSIVVFQPGVQGADTTCGYAAWVESVESRSDGLYVHFLEMTGPGGYDRRVVKDVPGMSYILAP